jgi:phosphatidate cytidylyltransferase
VATAAVALPLLIAAVLWQRPEGLFAICLVAMLIGLDEFYRLTLARADDRALGLVASALFAITFFFCPEPAVVPVLLAFVTIGLFAYLLVRPGELGSVAGRLTALVCGILYLPLLLGYVPLLRRLPDGAAWVLVLLSATWLGDTFAFFAGRAAGKHKLYPRISPGKTVEGAVGGLVGSLAAAVVAKLWYLPRLDWIDCLAVAVPAALLGQVGDLCESMLKRGQKVKDSGNLLPGHGGMLDRIDALLFAAPFVYFYARFLFR